MATSAVSSAAASSAASVGQGPGMLFEEEQGGPWWLRQELIIGDGFNVVTATRSWYLGFNFRVLG